MSSLFGKILTSAPNSNDTTFSHTRLLLVEHNDRGAVGFVLNIPLKRNLNELVEFVNNPPLPIYIGGPVDQEHLFFLHRRPDLIEGGLPIRDGVYYGGNFEQVLHHLNQQQLADTDIFLLLGYAGWDPGQLESEIEQGEWMILDEPIKWGL